LRTEVGDIRIEASGTLAVSAAAIEAAPPGDYTADVKLKFRSPLVGTPASLIDLDGALYLPMGFPPPGPEDTVELVSRPFTIPPDIDSITFYAMFLTDEIPGDTDHNDTFSAYLVTPDGARLVTTVDVATGRLQPALPLGSGFHYSTNQFAAKRVRVRDLAGTGVLVQLVLSIEDVGDSLGASAVLIDNVALRGQGGRVTIPVSTFESRTFDAFALNLTHVRDPFGAIVRGLGDVDRPPIGNFPGPEDNDFNGNGFPETAVPAPERGFMAVLSTGNEPFLFVQAEPDTVQAPCGDGVLEATEECDDGNRVSGDCCRATCELDPAGTVCDDGNACTTAGTCDGSGTCSTSPVSCDDGDPCTADSCDPSLGCQHIAVCSPTPTAPRTATPSVTSTPVPTATNTASPTVTPTPVPTDTPSPVPTDTPTSLPSDTPTLLPTDTPTSLPTNTPTALPTDTPTSPPTETPTAAATETPTPVPTDTPSPVPTDTPTSLPSDTPTLLPTDTPTALPTDTPTPLATDTPTSLPTDTPTP